MRRLIVPFLLLSLVSCGAPGGSPLCAGRITVGDYVMQFGQGLANFDDQAALNLQADSISVLDVLLSARDAGGPTGEAARRLADKVAAFVAAMNTQDWIISLALDDAGAQAASEALATEESLRQANTVEAHVLRECPGTVTAAPPPASYDTLPGPSIPSPTATDPPYDGPKEESEARALGTLVGTSFGLTMTPAQVLCVGRALEQVTDATRAQSGPGQYAAQYQAAFDGCGVDFTVPES